MAQFVLNLWLIEFIRLNDFQFEWDLGNENKSVHKHNVNNTEVEEVFEDENKLILGIQVSPKTSENRYAITGKSSNGVGMFVCFTIRNSKIRIISARVMNFKERMNYEKKRSLFR